MNNDNTDYVSNESGTLSRLFKLPQHGTTVRTELIAGMTTFLTMVYIVFVNPQILGAAQMDPKVGNDSNLLIVFYVQIMPDDFVMQLHRF